MADRKRISQAVIRAYKFLIDHETRSATFAVPDLTTASGWKESSTKTNVAKKLRQFLIKVPGGYQVKGLSSYSQDDFLRLMSQKQEVAADPKNPRLAPEIESLLRKARESALLALQVYNNPTTVFKTEGFIVLMVIAWTALLHAVFRKKGIECHHKELDGTVVLIEGDPKMWELTECLRQFYGGNQSPVRTNLEFFIGLRNKIEHRYVPAIDPHVSGECQAMLLNFDELLAAEFGPYFGIRDSLTIPLQTATVRNDEQGKVLKKLQAGHFEEVKNFIDDFRARLDPTVGTDQRYRFQVFLVPKVGNHRTSSDLAIEFVRVDSKQANELGNQIVAIKERQVPVHNANLLKPTAVARAVAKRLGKKFTINDHILAWKKFNVRPSGFSTTGCNLEFCVPDVAHQDFLYTEKWVEFLVKTLSDEAEYQAVLSFKPGSSNT